MKPKKSTVKYKITVYCDGTKVWRLDGKIHREKGPAAIMGDGTRAWYRAGMLHRVTGPAVECPDGSKAWFINGVRYTENVFLKKMKEAKKKKSRLARM